MRTRRRKKKKRRNDSRQDIALGSLAVTRASNVYPSVCKIVLSLGNVFGRRKVETYGGALLIVPSIDMT